MATLDVGKQEPGVIEGIVAERKPASTQDGVHMVVIVSGPSFDRYPFYASARPSRDGRQSWFDRVPEPGRRVRLRYELRAELKGTLQQGKARGQLGVKPSVVDAEAVGMDADGAPPLPGSGGGDALTRRRAA